VPLHTTDVPTTSEEVARYVAGAGMLLAGLGHLTFARDGFRAQVPPWIPFDADATVLVSGGVELSAGLGMIILPRERRTMSALLAAFLVGIFPGNIEQFRHGRDGAGLDSARKRTVRLAAEPVMWAVALHAGGYLNRWFRR
jgi:uncharacterized membrane protein